VTGRSIELALTLDDERTAFEPGARVSGVAAWSARAAPLAMELRLTRAVRGPGGRDFTIAETVSLPKPLAVERRLFTFTLPTGPYSFHGDLISLTWAFELVASPGDDKVRLEITLAPGAREIDLSSSGDNDDA
jgi:hypothetical protein